MNDVELTTNNGFRYLYLDALDPPANKSCYIAVWRRVLAGWLHWPDERVRRWIKRHEADLEGRGNAFFYHEEALWYVTRFLIPDRLVRHLDKWGARNGPPTSLRLSWRLQSTIGTGIHVEGNPAFDWDAARERVEAVLEEYGETLAGPGDHIDQVRGILGDDCP